MVEGSGIGDGERIGGMVREAGCDAGCEVGCDASCEADSDADCDVDCDAEGCEEERDYLEGKGTDCVG